MFVKERCQRSNVILLAIVYRWQTKDKRSQISNENATNLVKNIRIPFYKKHKSFATACSEKNSKRNDNRREE